jgi:hypothetical protein
MASANAPDVADSILPANKDCDNCCANIKAKVACPLCWPELNRKKNKNATPKSKPLEKNKHAQVEKLLDSAPEGDENDDYIFQSTPLTIDEFCQCCWRVICSCKESDSETKPLPAYREVTKRILLGDKQLATDKEVNRD